MNEAVCVTHGKPLADCPHHQHWVHLVEDAAGGEVPPTPTYPAAEPTPAVVSG